LKRIIYLIALAMTTAVGYGDDLMTLIAGNDLPRLEAYVAQNGVSLPNYRIGKFGPLFAAAAMDIDPGIISYLIKSGCDVNEQLPESLVSPVMVAARLGKSVKVLRALLESGADPQQKDMHGKTALLLSVASNDMVAPREQWDFSDVTKEVVRSPTVVEAIVETLLAAGSSINEKDSEYQSILHVAAKEQPSEVIKFLLKKGADVNARNVYGSTPLFYAAESNGAEVIELLISNGAVVSARDKYGMTALFSAVGSNPSPPVIRILLKAGLDLNSRGLRGTTAAIWGFYMNENLPVLEEILNSNPDLTLVDGEGQNIMYYANINKALANTPTYWRLNDAYWAQQQRKR
jgi:ankyrin repeat protein